MRSKARSRQATAALVLSAVAVFFAVGGVGYASRVVHLISGTSIKKGTIPADRLTKSARASLKGQTGPAGPTGPLGPQGPAGQNGTNGTNGTNGKDGTPGPSRGNFNKCTDASLTSDTNGTLGGQSAATNCTVQITAPTSGKLLVTASSELQPQDAACATPDTVTAFQNLGTQGVQQTVAAKQKTAVSTTWAEDVSAGAHSVTYTMTLQYDGICSSGTKLHYNFRSQVVSVVFVQGPS